MHRLVGQIYMGPDETLWWIWSTWSIIFLPRLSPSPIYSVFTPGRKRFLTYQEANLIPFSAVESTVCINLACLVVQGQKHQRAISKQRHFVNKTQQMMEPKISDLNCHCSEIARSGGCSWVVSLLAAQARGCRIDSQHCSYYDFSLSHDTRQADSESSYVVLFPHSSHYWKHNPLIKPLPQFVSRNYEHI